tara:strand:+ start:90 stop:1142 length:1053 start_codon:yes stop_codon:yes gene_type:complete
MSEKSVSVIGVVGVPACYGGFETLVENLVDGSRVDIRYTIYCSSKNYKEKSKFYKKAKLVYLPISANGISSILYDSVSLLINIFKKTDTTLILGLSGMLFLPIYKIFSKSKIVTNVDGIEWKRDKWNSLARKYLKFCEQIAVKHSDVIISDNEGIAEYIYREYDIKAKTIAYGGDHALKEKSNLKIPYSDYYLSICRIEPENNVEMILNAFSETSKKIIFIGNWDVSSYGLTLKEKFKDFSNIIMLDPIYCLSSLYEYRKNCIGYIHGHSAGGTNPSLVEMMFFSKEIFAYDCNFNRFTTENNAYFFKNACSLNEAIEKNIRNTKINDLRRIAEKKYTWSSIRSSYESLY